MLRKSTAFVGGSVRDQPFCDEFAAFLNERMIREIINGMNLESAVAPFE